MTCLLWYICAFISEIQKEIAPEERVCNNIGVTAVPVYDRSKTVSVANANRRNNDLERAARHRTRTLNSFSVLIYRVGQKK